MSNQSIYREVLGNSLKDNDVTHLLSKVPPSAPYRGEVVAAARQRLKAEAEKGDGGLDAAGLAVHKAWHRFEP